MSKNVLDSFIDISAITEACSNQVVIDCGHTSLNYDDHLYFGRDGEEPSDTEVKTLELGLNIAEQLNQQGKQVLCNICFSDVSKNLTSPLDRIEIKRLIETGTIVSCLPKSYRHYMDEFKKLNVPIKFLLQTMNSNLFVRFLKKTKDSIRQISDVTEVYRQYKACFITDQHQDLFGLISPFTFDNTYENNQMGGDWWQDLSMQIHPSDLLKAPLLNVKKLQAIPLFSKRSGILCPGTYMGLVLSYDKQVDRIAIYSRNDDPLIGEKINRAIIAAFHLLPGFCSTCIQVIKPEVIPGYEITKISKTDFPFPDFKDFKKLCETAGINTIYKDFI